MSDAAAAWTQLSDRIRELDNIGGALALLDWDQQCYMPSGAGAIRGEQSATLGKIYHERFTAPDVGAWLATLADADLDLEKRAAVRNATRRYRRATCLPSRLVEDLAKARNEGFMGWLKAKESGDFSIFEAPLQRLIDLSREQAALTDPAGHPYDVLLEEYDPGSSIADLGPMFARLGGEIGKLLAALEGVPHPAGFEAPLDVEGQRRLSDRVLTDLGFNKTHGRMDNAEHPFTSGFHATDVRLTTHLHADKFLAGLGSTIHECGHGLYEQGLRTDWDGTGLNRAAGYGIHESQSRFWENTIGRSMPYCRYLVPRMQGIWPDLDITPESLFAAANRVERSLIRIYADEATYNLHIIVRYELEVAIFEGRLQARDLPAAWDAAYERIVGVKAGDPKEGVLQDVHWSSGLFAYFPSYTIGNLYAASFARTMEADLPNMWDMVERGEFATILEWLRARIHRVGHLKDAPLIFRDIVGDRDPVEDLVAHLWERQGKLYGVTRG